MNFYTILLYEDEPVVALHLKRELEAQGHKVLSASNRAEALALCLKYLPEFAIINFREEYPDDGMELARMLRVRFLIKTLLITGARIQDLEESPDFYAGQHVLFKPYTPLQLRQSVAGFLS